MKRILVFSDSHGYTENVNNIAELIDQVDYVYFLGDGYGDVQDLLYAYPNKVEAVIGNCDHYFDAPVTIINKVENVTFLLTHGHAFHVKYGYEEMVYAAKRKKVDCVLFGHTHSVLDDVYDGVRLINPGSLGNYFNGTYCILTIADKNIQVESINLLQNS